MTDDSSSYPILKKFQRLMDDAITMVPRGDTCVEFHMKDGSITTLTLSVEVKGESGTRH